MIPLKTWRDRFSSHLSNSCGLRTIKRLMKHMGTVHEGPGSLMLFCVLFFRTTKWGARDGRDFYQTRRDQLRVLCVCSPGPLPCFCVFMLFTLIFNPFLSIAAATAHEGTLWALVAWDHCACHNKEKTAHICKWAPASWTGFLKQASKPERGCWFLWNSVEPNFSFSTASIDFTR